MSLELVLRPGDGRPFDLDALRGHFSRPHYALDDGVGLKGAWSHPDTDGTFSFELEAPGKLKVVVPTLRAHVVALEADLELRALADRFPLTVEVPEDGPRDGWDTQRFLDAWTRGNRDAVAHFARHAESHGHAPRTLGYELLEATWRWNHGRNALQAQLGDDVFVPRIFFFAEGNAVRRLVVWTDAIAMAFPVVDLVLLLRDDFGRQFLRKPEPSAALARWDEVAPFLASSETKAAPLPWTLWKPEQLVAEVVRFFVDREELEVPGPIAPLRSPEVLDEEVVATAGQAAS